MHSGTKVFILKLKQLIAALIAVILLIAIAVWFLGSRRTEKEDIQTISTAAYTAGVYTSSILLNNQSVDIQVVVDNDRVKSASIVNLDDAVATMYPLLESCMDNISEQLAQGTSPEAVTYSEASRYTSTVLLDAISSALSRAR